MTDEIGTMSNTATEKKATYSIKKQVTDLVVRFGKVKAVGQKKPVSYNTQKKRLDILQLMFSQLRQMGIRLVNVQQFRENHIKKLALLWEEQGLSAATIQNRISTARMFCEWIGKAGMVKESERYVKDPQTVKRTATAQKDKSWKAAGIDVQAMITMVSAYDPYVGMQLRMVAAFGMRREEAVMFRPWLSDEGTSIRVRDGTKGGRERSVAIIHPYQREELDAIKASVKKTAHIGNPELTLKQALRRFSYVMERFGVTGKQLGVTGHGLRHEFLNDLYEQIAGIPSPVRDEKKTTAPEEGWASAEQIDFARATVSEAAGHSRLSITNAYIGSTRESKKAGQNWTVRTPDEAEKWKRLAQLSQLKIRTKEQHEEILRLKKELGCE